MRATGIVRRIDDLGRVVIPKEIRRTLRIREGDSLEIYTDKQGEIVLKKYSPILELGEFAKEYVDSLAQTAGCIVAVTDRDHFVAVSSGGKKEFLQKEVSRELGDVMRERKRITTSGNSKEYIAIAGEKNHYAYQIISPIIAEGDVVGCVLLLAQNGKSPIGEAEEKLASFASVFLGKQMEQ